MGYCLSLCREQRLDGNLIVKLDEGFDAAKFVADVPMPSKLSVFFSSLSVSTIHAVSDALVLAMDPTTMIHPIVTLYMSSEPPRLNDTLKLIAMQNAQVQEQILDYVLILAKNEELVYAEALGTFDLR